MKLTDRVILGAIAGIAGNVAKLAVITPLTRGRIAEFDPGQAQDST